MTKWLLIIWISNCVGPDCQIPTYEKQEFDTEEECIAALDAWQGANQKFAGVCIESRYEQGVTQKTTTGR